MSNDQLPNPVPEGFTGVPSLGTPQANQGFVRHGAVTTNQIEGASGRLYVTIKRGKKYLKWATEKDPRNKNPDGTIKEVKEKDIDIIRIEYPGGDWKETELQEYHKQQFPEHWEFYCNNERSVIGTPIGDWGGVKADFAEVCRANNIYTVEQLADLTDANLSILGLDGRAIREKAQNWVGGASGREADKEKEELKAEVAELRELVGQLLDKKPKTKKKQEKEENA